jgi:nucleotide-binding universal stress UspA family protein
MYYKILVGYDGSRGGKAALAAAAALARKFEGRVTALWVREPLPRHSDLPGEIEEESEAADRYFAERETEVAAFAAEHGIPIACDAARGHPAKAIVNASQQGRYDLIVIGHSDHSALWGRLLGDTADRIADQAPCSVLIVKTGVAAAPA